MWKTRKTRTRRWLLRVLVIGAVLVSMLPLGSGVADAATCGSSSGHTLCVTAPVSPLVGPATITITNSPNSGVVIATWIPSGGPNITLIQEFGPSPGTNNYSFTWPTQKYLDASGVLRVQANATNTTPVDVPVTLQNGNVSDFQHSPSNWESFLPNPAWAGATDPVIVAVGDGASDQAAGNNLAHSIALTDPEVLLYLGDIYETGTFTENLNHYGQNSMDGGPGTLWGAMGTFTQPTLGDHEAVNSVAWQDYFHGRPLYTSFEFANVLFVNLASTGVAFGKSSAQYNYVNSVLTSTNNPPPPCIITYFQNPVIAKDKVVAKRVPMWSLLTNNGGDLLFAGDNHTMIQYKPLNDQVELPSPGQPTMVEMISGAGGHSAGPTFTGDPRIDWSQGQTPGAVYVTLNGAAAGGVPTSLSWAYKDTNGNVLKSGTRNCGAGPPPPSITNFTPTSGPVGTSVTINGSGFTGTTDVRFNGTSVGSGNFTVVSGGQITATVPSGASTGPISLTAPGGTATSSTDFTVTAPVPSITNFTPTSGPVGTSVTINGSGFTGTTDVRFNGTSVGSGNFTVISGGQITATVPSGASTGPISLTAPGGTATSSTDFTVTAPVPSITNFTPTSGPVGTSVTINGSGFNGTTDVRFNGTSVGSGNFTVVSGGQITATVPSGASTGPISLTAPGGTATSSTDFTVTAPVPSITNFTPTSGPVGTSVTINGSGFTGTTDVRFNGTSVGSGNFTVVSGGQITATVPSGASTGPISLTAPGGTATSSTDFTVTTPPPPPVITDFTPSFGPVGTSVTINGSGFTGTTDVRFNGTSVGSGDFTVDTDGQITASVPSAATTGPISLTAPGGTATSSTDFTVTPPSLPVITDFTPSSGPVGTSVTINGSGFNGTTDVRFNGTSVGSGNFTGVSHGQITATVPSGASTGPISLTAPGGTATSLTDFTVTAPVPVITDFTPSSGPVGTSVTINGSGFTGTTDVRFNGTSVGSGNFTVVSGGQITATVPSGAGTGPISLTAPGGTATSSTNFTVTATTTLSFGPDADTFVRSDSPTAHPGSKVSFSVDGSPTQYGLLKFTVSGIPSGTIPIVKLRLYCLDASPKGGDFFRVANNSWQENTVTWNTQPLADPNSIASLGAVIASTWYEVDLSSLVTGNGTYSIRIASTSANAVDYSTKEGAAGFAPQLVVTFT